MMTDRERIVHFEFTNADEYELEATLLKKTTELLDLLGAHYLRSASTVTGDPDLYVCYKGHFICIELKAQGEEPRKTQLKQARKWRLAGATAGTCWSTLDVFMLVVLRQQRA